MAVQIISNAATGARQFADQVSATQNSSDAETVVSGSSLDTLLSESACFTFENTGANDIDVTVFRSNKSDFSDEAQDGAAIVVAAGARKSYVDARAGFRFYRLKLKSSSAGLPGTLVANGFAR